MTELFKVGEIAIGQNFLVNTECNGMECEVLDGLEFVPIPICAKTGEALPPAMCYFVEWAYGVVSEVSPSNLRKKRPPEADDATARQTMLDCIERAKQPLEVTP